MLLVQCTSASSAHAVSLSASLPARSLAAGEPNPGFTSVNSTSPDYSASPILAPTPPADASPVMSANSASNISNTPAATTAPLPPPHVQGGPHTYHPDDGGTLDDQAKAKPNGSTHKMAIEIAAVGLLLLSLAAACVIARQCKVRNTFPMPAR